MPLAIIRVPLVPLLRRCADRSRRRPTARCGSRTSVRREARQLTVCTADIDGSNVQVAFTEKELTCPEAVSWSPDGKRLAVVLFDWHLETGRKFLGGDVDAHYRIAIMDLDGGDHQELALDRAATQIMGIDWR